MGVRFLMKIIKRVERRARVKCVPRWAEATGIITTQGYIFRGNVSTDKLFGCPSKTCSRKRYNIRIRV